MDEWTVINGRIFGCEDCKLEYKQDKYMRVMYRKEECFRCAVKSVKAKRQAQRERFLLKVLCVTAFFALGFTLGNPFWF
jgi:hypothetical protein